VNVKGDASNTDGSILSRLAAIASGFIRKSAEVTADALKPGNVFVPGGSQAAQAATKVAADATQTAKKVALSAADGVRHGFAAASFVIVFVVGIWIWSVVKPRG
jgi:enhancing lycopene biosynthesis protein 2